MVGAELTGRRLAMLAASDIGSCRPNNEDVVRLDEALGVAIVADGMSRSRGGEIAASLAVETIHRHLVTALRCRHEIDPREILPGCFEAADAQVRDRAAQDPRGLYQGMGSALIVAIVDRWRPRLWLAHVGDVRAYLLRSGAPSPEPAAPTYAPPVRCADGAVLTCLTQDHSSVCAMVEAGYLSRADGRRHPLRARLNRAIGAASSWKPAVRSLDLSHGDRLLLCSDGLWEMVDDLLIAALLRPPASPSQVCDSLIRAALRAGGQDNVTVALLS